MDQPQVWKGVWPLKNKPKFVELPKGAKFTFNASTGAFSGTLAKAPGEKKAPSFQGLLLSSPIESGDRIINGFGQVIKAGKAGKAELAED